MLRCLFVAKSSCALAQVAVLAAGALLTGCGAGSGEGGDLGSGVDLGSDPAGTGVLDPGGQVPVEGAGAEGATDDGATLGSGAAAPGPGGSTGTGGSGGTGGLGQVDPGAPATTGGGGSPGSTGPSVGGSSGADSPPDTTPSGGASGSPEGQPGSGGTPGSPGGQTSAVGGSGSPEPQTTGGATGSDPGATAAGSGGAWWQATGGQDQTSGGFGPSGGAGATSPQDTGGFGGFGPSGGGSGLSGGTANTGGFGPSGGAGGPGGFTATGGDSEMGGFGPAGGAMPTGGGGQDTGGEGNSGGNPANPVSCSLASLPSYDGNGSITFYDPTSTVNCSFQISPSDNLAAMNTADYNSAAVCGACIEVTRDDGRSVVARVVDQCPTSSNPKCTAGHVDLSRAAFMQIGSESEGHLGTGNGGAVGRISWRYVPCEAQGNVTIRLKEPSNANWNEFLVEDMATPVAKFELNINGSWVAGVRQSYNYFSVNGGNVSLPLEARITDVDGNVITGTIQAGQGQQDFGAQIACQ